MTVARPLSAPRPEPVDRVALLAVPAVAYLTIFYALPLVWLLARSIMGPNGPTLEPLAPVRDDVLVLSGLANKNSLGGDLLAGGTLMSYWLAEREKHIRWKMAIELMKPQ